MHRLLAVAVVIAAPALAWGHAEEPNSQNVFAVDDGWVLRANVGIVRSVAPKDLICEEAFLGGSDWLLAPFGPTEWVTFGETGAVMRTDDGCRFDTVLQLARRPSDATVHGPSGSAAFVMNGVVPEDGEPEENGLWLSTDRGQSFALVQSFDPSIFQTTGVRFLDESTVIVSGYDRTNAGAAAAWRVDAETAAATPLNMPADVTYPYVLAANGGQIVLLGRRGEQILFWGPPNEIDRNELVAATWPSWATLSEDGQTAWVSGVDSGRGVRRGVLDDTGIASWESLAGETTAACVEPVGDELFICGLESFDEFDVLKITRSGAVDGVLSFKADFRGVRCDCPADSEVGMVCPLVWRELAPYFSLDPDDAPECVPPASDDVATGSDDAGSGSRDAGPSGDVGTQPGGCCATVAAQNRSGWLLLPLLFAVTWRRRALTQNSRRCY